MIFLKPFSKIAKTETFEGFESCLYRIHMINGDIYYMTISDRVYTFDYLNLNNYIEKSRDFLCYLIKNSRWYSVYDSRFAGKL